MACGGGGAVFPAAFSDPTELGATRAFSHVAVSVTGRWPGWAAFPKDLVALTSGSAPHLWVVGEGRGSESGGRKRMFWMGLLLRWGSTGEVESGLCHLPPFSNWVLTSPAKPQEWAAGGRCWGKLLISKCVSPPTDTDTRQFGPPTCFSLNLLPDSLRSRSSAADLDYQTDLAR